MNPRKKYVPTFDPRPVHREPCTAMYPSAPPVEIEAIGDNSIRLTVGDVSRVLDGIALSNAINECLGNYRASARRFRC